MPTSEDKIAKGIKCLCGTKGCEIELRVVDLPEDQVKIQIFNSKDIDSIVVNKRRLIETLKMAGRKQINPHYIQIMSLIPKDKTVLDLACGNGLPFFGKKFPSLVGVDIWKKKFDMPEYDEVYIHDIREITKLFPEKSFDVVTAIDTIEHLTKEEGFKLIEDAEKLALNKVIFFTPKKWSENKDSFENPKYWSYGNEHCLHKSHWTEKDFTDRGYEIILKKAYILAQKVMK